MYCFLHVVFFFFKQKTAYELRISDWSSDVCSSDLVQQAARGHGGGHRQERDPVDHDIDRLPAGAPVVRRQRLDTAAVEGDSRAELGDQQKDDISDAGGAERPGRPAMQDVDVALGQDVRERRSEEHTSELQPLMSTSSA